jgi:hypothetical protein
MCLKAGVRVEVDSNFRAAALDFVAGVVPELQSGSKFWNDSSSSTTMTKLKLKLRRTNFKCFRPEEEYCPAAGNIANLVQSAANLCVSTDKFLIEGCSKSRTELLILDRGT